MGRQAVTVTTPAVRERLDDYLNTPQVAPLFVLGDALEVLREFPSEVFDCCMTSPPYWGKREYANNGIGLERDYRDFIRNLGAVCAEIKRVLKPAGPSGSTSATPMPTRTLWVSRGVWPSS